MDRNYDESWWPVAVGSSVKHRCPSLASGYTVRATTRDTSKMGLIPGVEWVQCDLARPTDLDIALRDIDAAFFLVHGMGNGEGDYAETEQHYCARFS